MSDMVNHPDHYEAGSLEVIDIIEEFGLDFHRGNAVKYILRAGRKTDDFVEDLEKAIWYLNRFLDTQVRYVITEKGKAVMELRNAGIEVPLVQNIAFKYNDGDIRTLQQDGYWTGEHGENLSTDAILYRVKNGYGTIVDLDELDKPEKSDEQQKAVEQIKSEGFFVPDGDELYYVNPRGTHWKLQRDGKWYGPGTLSTEDVIRYLRLDGLDVRGTLRTSPTGFRTLTEIRNNPIEGDKIKDVDGDFWEYDGSEWDLDGYTRSQQEVFESLGPISLLDEGDE